MSEEKETNEQVEDVQYLLNQIKSSKNKILDSAEFVDIDKIKIKQSTIANQQAAISSIFDTKPSFQVICTQSGYSAKISAMLYKDILAITNSTLSNYENRKETYKILYSKITGFGVENWKPTFEDWLKLTSYGDVDTLFYGLYCATFQEKSTIKYECPWCRETEIAIIDNNRLIRVENRKEMLELTKRISKEADTVKKISEFSSVSNNPQNTKHVKLPDTKIIFSLKMPTLYKMLELLKTFNEDILASKSPNEIYILLTTEKVLIPELDGTYSYIENLNDVTHIIEETLSIDDMSILKEVVEEIIDSKHISYCVEKQKCSHCKKDIAQIPMNMEDLLFFQITEKRLS